MRAVRPAAMAVISVVILMIVVAPRPALASAPNLPAATASAPPRATSLPGAEEAAQNEIDDILTSAALVLVSGVIGIAVLMRGRL
jgi:hypothetical protein